jgi:hypothetical protein
MVESGMYACLYVCSALSFGIAGLVYLITEELLVKTFNIVLK